MTGFNAVHRVDVYAPGTGGFGELLQENVAVYIEVADAEKRVRYQAVTRLPWARLWLSLEQREHIVEGLQIFWRERGTWWTVRGMPEIYDQIVPDYVRAFLTANAADTLFATAAASV